MTADVTEHDVRQFPLADPGFYQREGYPHEHWLELRRRFPVARVESGSVPFWAVTRHADITAVGKQPELFLNKPRLMILDREEGDFERPPTIIDMDPPEHGKYRRAISQRFTPRAVRRIHGAVEHIARNDFEGERTERVYSLLAKCPAVAALVEHPRVMEILDAFLRPSRLLSACQATRIHPQETVQLLHCDDELGAPPRPRAPQCVSTIRSRRRPRSDYAGAGPGARGRTVMPEEPCAQ